MELLIIDGPTGSGKSALLQHVREAESLPFCVVKKLTTRQKRDVTDDDHLFVGRIPDDSRYLKYEDVGATYAIDIDELRRVTSQKKIPVVVCTSANVIRELRECFDVRTLFVYRHFDERTLDDLMMKRGVVDQAKIAERLSELETLAERYTDRILLYDHVILNIGAIEFLYFQFDRVLRRELRGK
ncbi:hypothetical protein KC887_05150 [Candidatus Kaiserbacteria bacterium]|nr:hypothetical protein [Candidatus Kaiserbacteria bacterium]